MVRRFIRVRRVARATWSPARRARVSALSAALAALMAEPEDEA